MSVDIITVDTLSPFCKFTSFNKPNATIFTGLFSNDNDNKRFKQYCDNFLNGAKHLVNLLDLERCSFNLINNNVNLYNIIINSIDEKTTLIREDLEKAFHSDCFSVELFIQKYNEYTINCASLRKALRFIDKYYITESGKNMFFSIKNFLFCKNVLSYQFTFENKKQLLNKILVKCLKRDNINQVLSVVKLFSFYQIFANSIKEHKKDFFDESVLELSSDENLISGDLVQTIVKEIDTIIRNAISNSAENLESEITKVVDYIKTCVRVGDKALFLLTYEKYLQERIISRSTNIDVEFELLKAVGFKTNPDLFVKMKYMIVDLKASNVIEKSYRNLRIKPTSAKYESMKIVPEKDFVKLHILRSYAWDNCKYAKPEITTRINEPMYVSYYIDTAEKLYLKSNGDKAIKFNYEDSKTVFNLTLDKTYSFKANLLQTILIAHLVANKSSTAQEISEKLNIDVKYLSMTINSLLVSKLITRSAGATNDKNIAFSINKDFTFADTNVDLIECVAEVKRLMHEAKLKKQAQEETKAKAMIFSYLVEHKFAKHDKLKEALETDGLVLSDADLKSLLAKITESGKITLTDDTYVYVVANDSDSDSDSSDDSDDSSVQSTDDNEEESVSKPQDDDVDELKSVKTEDIKDDDSTDSESDENQVDKDTDDSIKEEKEDKDESKDAENDDISDNDSDNGSNHASNDDSDSDESSDGESDDSSSEEDEKEKVETVLDNSGTKSEIDSDTTDSDESDSETEDNHEKNNAKNYDTDSSDSSSDGESHKKLEEEKKLKSQAVIKKIPENWEDDVSSEDEKKEIVIENVKKVEQKKVSIKKEIIESDSDSDNDVEDNKGSYFKADKKPIAKQQNTKDTKTTAVRTTAQPSRGRFTTATRGRGRGKKW